MMKGKYRVILEVPPKPKGDRRPWRDETKYEGEVVGW
jgi:hypothetical protein